MIGSGFLENGFVGALAAKLFTYTPGNNLKLGLVVNNVTPSPSLAYADLAFATFTGSTPKSHSTTLTPYFGRAGNPAFWGVWPRIASVTLWQVASVPSPQETVFGFALYKAGSPNVLLAYQSLTEPIPVAEVNEVIEIPNPAFYFPVGFWSD